MSTFESMIETLMCQESRYTREAYVFVQMAMDYYRAKYGNEQVRHLTGQELLKGLEELALDQFGPMAPQVLNHWGLFRGEDVGEIVYLFLEHGVMNKSDSDRIEDFADVIEFSNTMSENYRW